MGEVVVTPLESSPEPDKSSIRDTSPEGEAIARNMRQLEEEFDGVFLPGNVMALTAWKSYQ